jgi:hypothetical protein
VFLQPLSEQGDQLPATLVHLFREWADGFGTRRQWVERIAHDITKQLGLGLSFNHRLVCSGYAVSHTESDYCGGV